MSFLINYFHRQFFFLIVAVGRFSLWQLAVFHCGSWQKNSRPFFGAGVFI